MAVVLGNNRGLADEPTLQYATRDAQQIYSVLSQLGGMDRGAGYLLLNQPVSKAQGILRQAKSRMGDLRARGEKVLLLIYFSGHGSGEALHLNGEKLSMSWIREYFGTVNADLKILIADACFSGALINPKGAILRNPIPVTYLDSLQVNGSAILTSSSAGELSQESRELRGSLFTYYLLTGLRGGADFDGDGQVNLWEAYNFTRSSLRRRYIQSKEPSQSPEFEVDLRGSDNVVLTRLKMGRSFLTLKGISFGEYRIYEAMSAVPIAQVFIHSRQGTVLALPKAPYLIYRGAPERGEAGFADLRSRSQVELGSDDFSPANIEQLSAKGMLGPRAVSRLGRRPRQFSLQPRLYPRFPGGDAAALVIEASVQTSWRDWGGVLSLGYLPMRRIVDAGNVLEQEGLEVGAGLRYYWSYSRWGASFFGSRVEGWDARQSVNGKSLGVGRMAGGFAGMGWERNFPHSLSLSLNLEAGMLWSYGSSGELRRHPAFPLALGIGYGI